jgi:hypothetical protein
MSAAFDSDCVDSIEASSFEKDRFGSAIWLPIFYNLH